MASNEKQRVCKKIYVLKDGTERTTLPADPSTVKELQFHFLDENKTVRTFRPENYSESIRDGFTFFGSSEAHGNSYAGVKGDAIAAIAAWDARDASFRADKWSSHAGTGGTRLDSILAEAVMAYFTDVGKTETMEGTPIDAAWVRAYLLAEDVSDDEVAAMRKKRKKQWMANDSVKAHYEAIRARREADKTSEVEALDIDDI